MTKNKFLSNIIIILVLLLQLFRYYDFPFTTVSMNVVILFSLSLVFVILSTSSSNSIESKINIKSRMFFCLFVFWMVLISIIYFLINNLLSEKMNIFIGTVLFAFSIFGLLTNRIDLRSSIKIYTFFVYTLIIIYALQWVLILNGLFVDFKMPFLKYSNSWIGLEKVKFGMNNMPSSLFSERSHFCNFLLPFVIISLFDDRVEKKTRLIRSIIVSFVIISTISGNGIVSLLIAWSLYFLFGGQAKSYKRIIIVFLGLIFILGTYQFLRTIPDFANMFSRLFSDNSGSSYYYSKADYRIYRGFDIWKQIPFGNKIIGVGAFQMEPFAFSHGISSIYDSNLSATYEYLSMIFELLIYTGFIGTVFYFLHLYHLFKNNNKAVKTMIIVFIALMFSTEMFFNEAYVFYIMFIVALSRMNNVSVARKCIN